MALRKRAPAPRPHRRHERPGRHLRALPPAGGQRRHHGVRQRHARDPNRAPGRRRRSRAGGHRAALSQGLVGLPRRDGLLLRHLHGHRYRQPPRSHTRPLRDAPRGRVPVRGGPDYAVLGHRGTVPVRPVRRRDMPPLRQPPRPRRPVRRMRTDPRSVRPDRHPQRAGRLNPGIPRHHAPLLQAERVPGRAGRVGFRQDRMARERSQPDDGLAA